MSYDLMVLDKHKRYNTSNEFLEWYNNQIESLENIDTNNYRHATSNLQSWFLEMKNIVRPLNGEFAPFDEELDCGDYHEADYCIAKDSIYMAIAWSDVERVFSLVKDMARKHDVALYDVSGSGDVIYPDGTMINIKLEVQEDVETDYMRDFLQKMNVLEND